MCKKVERKEQKTFLFEAPLKNTSFSFSETDVELENFLAKNNEE
jgi:hypothetical protein